MAKCLQILRALALVGTAAASAISSHSIAQVGTPLRCSDFVRNSNGSWSPVRPVTINGVTMGPGVAFAPGVAFGGVDLAAVLNQQCS
jgi:hypothetical protein